MNYLKNKCLVVAVLAGLFGASVQAIPITGSISFNGGVTLDTASAGTATKVLAWVSPAVSTASGTFSGSAGAVSISSPWFFASPPGVIPPPPFWIVNGFAFTMSSSVIVSQGTGVVNVSGIGTISKAGFETTTGTWSFITRDPGVPPQAGGAPVFQFSASGAAIPDGGTTVMLLGTALLGLGLIKKRLTA